MGKPIPATTSSVSGVPFSPDGPLLATADGNGTVRLWNPATGRLITSLPVNPGGSVIGVTFGPADKLLISDLDNGFVQLLHVPLFTDPYKSLCAEVGPPTLQTWIQYAPGETEPRICE